MEFAGFVSHLMQNSINGLEFLTSTELMENNSIGGVVMTKTPLTRYPVKNVEGPQWIFLAFHQLDSGVVRNKLGFPSWNIHGDA